MCPFCSMQGNILSELWRQKDVFVQESLTIKFFIFFFLILSNTFFWSSHPIRFSDIGKANFCLVKELIQYNVSSGHTSDDGKRNSCSLWIIPSSHSITWCLALCSRIDPQMTLEPKQWKALMNEKAIFMMFPLSLERHHQKTFPDFNLISHLCS